MHRTEVGELPDGSGPRFRFLGCSDLLQAFRLHCLDVAVHAIHVRCLRRHRVSIAGNVPTDLPQQAYQVGRVSVLVTRMRHLIQGLKCDT